MESNVLAMVLTSSVVAGVISSLVAYFQFHKNNKLVYITNERKAWRSDIRRIAEEIEAATGYEDIRKPLVELKVRINAYGKNTDDVKKDSHIWKVIERLQKQNDRPCSRVPEQSQCGMERWSGDAGQKDGTAENEFTKTGAERNAAGSCAHILR